MYAYLFDLGRDKAHKNLDINIAIDLWELVLGSKCRFITDWIQFLKTEKKDLIVMTKDTWSMLLELVE